MPIEIKSILKLKSESFKSFYDSTLNGPHSRANLENRSSFLPLFFAIFYFFLMSSQVCFLYIWQICRRIPVKFMNWRKEFRVEVSKMKPLVLMSKSDVDGANVEHCRIKKFWPTFRNFSHSLKFCEKGGIY